MICNECQKEIINLQEAEIIEEFVFCCPECKEAFEQGDRPPCQQN